jgi:ABC-type glycerol-3-phosphate transport system permease component
VTSAVRSSPFGVRTSGHGPSNRSSGSRGTNIRTSDRSPITQDQRGFMRFAGYCFLAATALVFGGPLLWMVATSLKARSQVFDGPLIPHHVQFGAYGYIWSGLGLGGYYLNSVIVTTITVAGVVLASSLAGYAFVFIGIPGKRALFAVMMFALLIPAPLLLIPAFVELRGLGLLNTRSGLALIQIGIGVPFATFLMRGFFRSVSGELRDAARVDGASELKIFWRVALPLCLPGVATVAIFQVLFTWNELMLSNGLIQSRSLETLQPALYSLVGEHATNWPVLTAALTVAALPVVVFFVVVQRYFVAGLQAGAVKG